MLALKGFLDHPANRYVVWLVRSVTQVLRQGADRVRKAAKRKSLNPDLAHWCESRASLLEDGARELESLLKRSALGSLPSERASEAAFLSLRDSPTYGQFHRLGQIFLSPRFRLPDATREVGAPIRPSYELYELWTFLALRRLLERHLPGAQWLAERVESLRIFDERPNKHEDVGYTALFPGQGTLRLLFNPTFASFLMRKAHARWSISAERRPDMVLCWVPEQGKSRWLCLDAKYRTDLQQVADAFSSAHIYRDSLRWRGFGEGGRCEGAALLVPAIEEKTRPWFIQDFRNEHGVGAFLLSPGLPQARELLGWLGERLGWSLRPQ